MSWRNAWPVFGHVSAKYFSSVVACAWIPEPTRTITRPKSDLPVPSCSTISLFRLQCRRNRSSFRYKLFSLGSWRTSSSSLIPCKASSGFNISRVWSKGWFWHHEVVQASSRCWEVADKAAEERLRPLRAFLCPGSKPQKVTFRETEGSRDVASSLINNTSAWFDQAISRNRLQSIIIH